MMAIDSGRRKPDAPLFYTIKDVQQAIGPSWSQRRVRRWLSRAGALERRYGTVVTTPERLASSFPEVYQRLLRSDEDDDRDDRDDDDEDE
ncbi:MAG TPA: hypothetical protein VFQ61_06590 [Polyangiaceae bacterium]|nr:hypothetical protein [Polyangiaceae bacterium]